MKLLCYSLLPLLLLWGSINSTHAAGLERERTPARNESKAGEVINFSLLDYKGKHYELRRTDAKIVILYFTSFACTESRQSLSKLRALRSQFGTNGVVIWMVNSATHQDPDDKIIEMLVRSRRSSLVPEAALNDPEALRLEVLKSVAGSLPVLRDEKQIVARSLGVTRIGEAIAIDVLTSSIIYRGAIDDAVAGEKAKPKTRYV
ncbi:MAG TPA: redoxin domain-containing protein, partial [Candidatus Saccharimonadales bacterium]|nr:redoxin domain-containing protein [Candidatus Saccharimonadales bacterium]